MQKSFSGGFSALAAAILLLGASSASANPQGGEVAAGSATISEPAAGSLAVTQQSDKAVINWQSFSIGQGESVSFAQPSSSSIALNRVVGGDLSTIAGTLSANGMVFLVNPNGVVFTKTAKVDVNGLLATTNDIANDDFMAGRFDFRTPGNPGAMIVNAGHLTAAESGLIGLVAPSVENDGVIAARLGRIALGSGDAFTLDLYGDQLISFLVPSAATPTLPAAAGPLVSNSGTLSADSGVIWLGADTARRVVDQAIDTTGIIEASAVHAQGGDIVLDGGDNGAVTVAGTIDASGKATGQTGGSVKVLGTQVAFTDTAKIDVSGSAGGGTALIGGNFHGAGAERNAATTTIAAGATVKADALDAGNGGQVAVWSDGQTNFYGSISARGGSQSGDGGFVEVSGHKLLDYAGTTDLRAPNGNTGSLLLDPEDVTISASGASPTLPAAGSAGYDFNPTSAYSVLSVYTLNAALALADVTVSTGSAGAQSGDITVVDPILWTTANTLTLSAHRHIFVNSSISNSGGAAVNLRADSDGVGIGTVSFGAAGAISTSGNVSIFFNPSVNPAGSGINVTSYKNPLENFSGHVGGGGSLTAFMLVNSIYDLQNIKNNLSADYALGRNIDASSTVAWNGGTGFVPIGSAATPFTGTLNGQQHMISYLVINPSYAYSGLFGYVDNPASAGLYDINFNHTTISNGSLAGLIGLGEVAGYTDGYVQNITSAYGVMGLVGINDGAIISSSVSNLNAVRDASVISGPAAFGGIAGLNYGLISDSSVSGQIWNTSATPTSDYLGGLAGANTGTILDSHASVTVHGSSAALNGSGGDQVGGLVGLNTGSITGSYATGSVLGGGNAGGLVGYNFGGSISTSYATGNVSGGSFYGYGGLVGTNTGSITNAYARGSVTGTYATASVGGLVGANYSSIATAYSTGFVTGTGLVGGLVGYEGPSATMFFGYWDNQTSGRSTSAAGTGAPTSDFMSALQSVFGPPTWASSGSVNNGYPYMPVSGGGGPVSGSTTMVNFGASPQTQQALDQTQAVSNQAAKPVPQPPFNVASISAPAKSASLFNSIAAQTSRFAPMQADIQDSLESITDDVQEIALILGAGHYLGPNGAEAADVALQFKSLNDNLQKIQNGQAGQGTKNLAIGATESVLLPPELKAPVVGQAVDVGARITVILGAVSTEALVSAEMSVGEVLGTALYDSGIYSSLASFFSGE